MPAAEEPCHSKDRTSTTKRSHERCGPTVSSRFCFRVRGLGECRGQAVPNPPATMRKLMKDGFNVGKKAVLKIRDSLSGGAVA